VDALAMAIQHRLPDRRLIAHSDRGSQYASNHYQRLLQEQGIVCSTSGVAQCWDNAPVESFFASLKRELVHDERYTTREQAKTSIFEYVEAFYNRVRLHSFLGYLTRPTSSGHTTRFTVNFVSTFSEEDHLADVETGVDECFVSLLQQATWVDLIDSDGAVCFALHGDDLLYVDW
jgi:hypothetical protein